jgi:tetratricopeptide (TPR) repeat protein
MVLSSWFRVLNKKFVCNKTQNNNPEPRTQITMGRFSKLDLQTKPPLTKESIAEAWPNEDEQSSLRRAQEAFDHGLYEPALDYFSRALRFNRELPQAWCGQIRCLIQLGEFPEAITWSDRALERFPNNANLLACKGLAYAELQDTIQAMEYVDGALEQRSPTPWVWLARGECLLLAREPVQNAQRCFAKAAELEDDLNRWRVELRIGQALLRAGHALDAKKHLERARHGQARNELVNYLLGLTCERLGQYSLAANYLQQACAERRFPQALDALGRVRSPFWQRWWKNLTGKE